MVPNAVFPALPDLRRRRRPRLRAQPGLLRLLLQGRLRLLLERRPESPALRRPALLRPLYHPLGHETHLGTPHRRFPGQRVPTAAVFRPRRRRRCALGGGGGARRGDVSGGGGGVPDGAFGGGGDCGRYDRRVHREEQHRDPRFGIRFAEPMRLLLLRRGFARLLF